MVLQIILSKKIRICYPIRDPDYARIERAKERDRARARRARAKKKREEEDNKRQQQEEGGNREDV